MRTAITIVGARTFYLDLDILAQLNLATLLPFGSTGTGYFSVGTTTSLAFVPLYTASYNIDSNGKIIVVMISLTMFSNNSANGESKFQVSGDGGVTFVDVTNTIPTGLDQARIGAGLWITEVQPGTDVLKKLQFRVMGRSTNGALATINVRDDSHIVFIFNKKII